jgi:23S rRNA (uracil1939-C5)-methyltransferase
VTPPIREAVIESLDHEGGRHPSTARRSSSKARCRERVCFASYKVKPNYEQAEAVRVLEASSQRVEPACEHFGVCGGCSMQHLESSAQVAAKRRVLENALWHWADPARRAIRHRRAGLGLPLPRTSDRAPGAEQGRRADRLPRAAEQLCGTDGRCPILPRHVSDMMPRLRADRQPVGADRLPQIEIAVGEGIACWCSVTCCRSQGR